MTASRSAISGLKPSGPRRWHMVGLGLKVDVDVSVNLGLMAQVLRIHHCAFAHDSSRSPEKRFDELLGMAVCHSEDVDGFTERMIPAGDGYVQTLEATGPGVVERFVANRGSALHHIAFEVDDIEGCLQELRAKGVRLVDEKARPGGMGTMIAFVHPSEFDGLLVELVEVPKTEGEE